MYLYTIESNGDLMWHRHVGSANGVFRWEGPEKIASGWDRFEQVLFAGSGIIYTVTPNVEASAASDAVGKHGHGASGGDLLWYRHVGWEDGTWRWEGPNKVGTGWSGFQRLFAAGDGIIYGITEVVEAGTSKVFGKTRSGHPESGGDLMWYRHHGHEDGSFRWAGPKKVGVGWGHFRNVFSGGDGVIYAVTPVVAATAATGLREGMEARPASGGDLMWYRHLGRDDGSFRWEDAKKVGVGWGDLETVLAGDDGIIYAVTPVVEGRASAMDRGVSLGGPATSGGELRWYNHLGREDGRFRWEGPKKVGTRWGGLKRVSCGGHETGSPAASWRCGVPDPSAADIHVATAGAASGRWSHGNLTYNVNVGNTRLTQANVDAIMRSAFDQWQAVAPFFSFKQVPGAADLNIQFGGSALEPEFGTAGNTTGLGYPPEDGRIMFDSAENWNGSVASQNSLLGTALHEIGHALGLRHSTSRGSLMYPYGPLIPIDGETSEAINGLYGWQPQQPLSDRASTDGPSLAIAGTARLSGNDDRLYMAWRGPHGDDGLYWSVLEDNGWSPQANMPGKGSLHGPALATGYTSFGADGVSVTGLFLAWDGPPGDDQIYFAQNPNPRFSDWLEQNPVDRAASSARPGLAMFNGKMHMAWKGIAGDSTIYWSLFDGTSWAIPTPIPGRGTSAGPALAVIGNRLYMMWKGIDGDSDAYFAWLDDQPNAIWQVQQTIAYTEAQSEGNVGIAIGTSNRLGATLHGDAVLAAWKGALDDDALYFSRMRSDAWTGQIAIAGVGSASSPALASLNGRLYMAWRGIPGDTGLWYSWL